ncbi:MAG: hypothetical protein H8K07_22905 [Nitrospira sp.]|nr:hypothetical protein [Nitrospira sp.]
MVAWLSERRRRLWATLRAGQAGTANGAREVLTQALTRLPPGHRIGLVRADAGVCVTAFLTALEARDLPSIIVARLTSALRKLVLHRIPEADWRPVRPRHCGCGLGGQLASVEGTGTPVCVLASDAEGALHGQRSAADRVSRLSVPRLRHQCALCRGTGHANVRGPGGP